MPTAGGRNRARGSPPASQPAAARGGQSAVAPLHPSPQETKIRTINAKSSQERRGGYTSQIQRLGRPTTIAGTGYSPMIGQEIGRSANSRTGFHAGRLSGHSR